MARRIEPCKEKGGESGMIQAEAAVFAKDLSLL